MSKILFINAYDPYSIVGNGNNKDNSLDKLNLPKEDKFLLNLPKEDKFLLNLPKEFINYIFKNAFYKIKSLNYLIINFRKFINNQNYLIINNISGLFITIEKNNNLRGCIGLFKLNTDIIDTILYLSYQSAFNDTRFNPITIDEIDNLTYKITYLKTPYIVSLKNLFDEFIIGLHGITIYFKKNKYATYLASVMIDYFKMTPNMKLDLKSFDIIKKSLQIKSGSDNDNIIKIELYECI